MKHQALVKATLFVSAVALGTVNYARPAEAFTRTADKKEQKAPEQPNQPEQKPGEQGEQGQPEKKQGEQGQQGQPEQQGQGEQGQQGQPEQQGQGEQQQPNEQGQGEQQPNEQGQNEQQKPNEQNQGEVGEQGRAQRGQQENAAALPQEVKDLKASVISAFDSAIAGNQEDVLTTVTDLRAKWKDFRKTAIENKVSHRTIMRMDHQLRKVVHLAKRKHVNQFRLAHQVNKLNALFPSLYGAFDSNIPAEVLRLGYLQRELIIDGHRKHTTAAKMHLRRVEKTWKMLQPKLSRISGEGEVDSLNSDIDALHTAIQDKAFDDISRIGQEGLDKVNRIEDAFSK